MKSILLSVVVICALIVAGIGGTLADFSDSEEEKGDTLQAGSMDLKVNGKDDPNVLPFIIRRMKPDKWFDVTKKVSNNGTIDGHLYIHFKNVTCNETDDKGFTPEPEVVCQRGGQVGQQIVAGLGVTCNMSPHIAVAIDYDGTSVNLTALGLDKNGDGKVKLDELECEQIYLGILPLCGVEKEVKFYFLIQDVLDDSWTGDPKFAYWPTNCFMGDEVKFDVLFELLQTDYTPPGGGG
jgi:predicted ribosomally synthesized peptide with SipW-like signal peptide